ncbi:hypothetical protein Vafri_3357, partial [Volvox africanus]
DLGSVESTDRIFTGMCQNGRRCTKCQHVTPLGEPEEFKTLMLPIDMANSVAEALDNYMTQGSFDTKHYCAMCGSDEEAQPSASLLSVPDVLVLALKRFENPEMGARFGGSKVDNYVEFSTTADLQPFMLPGLSGPGEATYNLAGIVVHTGDLEGGHYVAYIRGNGGSWWCKDDKRAVKVPLEKVLAQKAYMLFYERVMPEQPNVPTAITAIATAGRDHMYDATTTTTASVTTTRTNTTSSYVTANGDCFDLTTSTTSSGAISDTAAAATVHGYWCHAAAAGATTTTTSGSLHADTMATATTTVTTTAAPDDPTADTAASSRRRCTHRRRQRGCIPATPRPPRPAHAVMTQAARKRLASSLPPSDEEESDRSYQQALKKPRLGTGLGFMSFKWLMGDYFSSVGATFHQWTAGVLVQRH